MLKREERGHIQMGVGIQSLGTRGFVPKGLFGRILHHMAFLEGFCTNRSVHQGILHHWILHHKILYQGSCIKGPCRKDVASTDLASKGPASRGLASKGLASMGLHGRSLHHRILHHRSCIESLATTNVGEMCMDRLASTDLASKVRVAGSCIKGSS